MSQSLKILIALTDSQLAHQMSQKLKKHFAKIEVDISVCEDGRRALNEFSQIRHDIVIATYSLPNLDGYLLAEEINKLVGGIGVYILSQKNENPSVGERIDLPIVNWSDLLNRIQNSVPDYIKTQFGISIHDSVLYDKLLDYAKKYRVEKSENEKASQKVVSLIPILFTDQESKFAPNKDAATSASSSVGPTVTGAPTNEVSFRELDKIQSKRGLIIELSILAGLLGLSLFINLKFEDGGALFSIRNLFTAVTALAFLGFFLGRVFDRYIFSKIAK